MANNSSYYHGVALYDLSPLISREIGRIIVRCGYLEYMLQAMIWRLLQITIPMGRIATRMPRAEDRLDMIRDVSTIRKIHVDNKIISGLKRDIHELFERRDILAHGCWTKTPDGRLIVLQVTGNWPKPESWPVRSRRIMPEALTASVEQLRTIVDGLDKMIERVRKLGELIPLEAPPEEHPEQFAHTDRPPGRKPSMRARHRGSSGE